MVENSPHREVLARQAKGDMVEIGPGPGTNFEYLSRNHEITSYVGIEPNTHMHAYFYERVKELAPPFPVDLRSLAVRELFIYAITSVE